jgi:hypothetical protein
MVVPNADSFRDLGTTDIGVRDLGTKLRMTDE